jgi:CRP/FNR family cyclic AMP-dependent transcriptional regulator
MTPSLKVFLQQQQWMQLLTEDEQLQVIHDTYERKVLAGQYVCRASDRAEQWVGVMSGLVKSSVTTSHGMTTTFASVSTGAWLGEGVVQNGTARRFDIIALKESRIALVPRATFLRLYNSNMGFCHYLISEMNKRLSQQMALIEFDRLLDPETRVARFLVMLAEAQMPSNLSCEFDISQVELGNLCGLSRQFINRVIMKLDSLSIVQHKRGQLKIIDLNRLRNFDSFSQCAA